MSWLLSYHPASYLLLGGLCFLLSWYVIGMTSRSVYHLAIVLCVEVISISIATIGSGFLFFIMIPETAPPKKVNTGGTARSLLDLTNHTSPSRNRCLLAMRCWGALLLWIHIYVLTTFLESHGQTKDVAILTGRVLCDGALLAAATCFVLYQFWIQLKLTVRSKRNRPVGKLLDAALTAIGVIVVGVALSQVLRIIVTTLGTATIPNLQLGILGESFDPCQGEDMQLNPSLSASWVLPALHPRRFFNFYHGAEVCRSPSWHSIGFVERELEILIVSAKCADGSKPRIFIDRPEMSELTGAKNANKDVPRGHTAYHERLEELYGSLSSEQSEELVVRRSPETHRIISVEWNPDTLRPKVRLPTSAAEMEARKWWPSPDKVIDVPLGRSAAYSVLCGASDEEYFVHPMRPAPSWEGPTRAPLNEQTKPVSSVLVIMLDAVSRQSVVRRMPQFVQWVRDFKQRQMNRKDGSYVVRELRHTTLGTSTIGNLLPTLTGDTMFTRRKEHRQEESFMGASVFNIVKETYGDRVSTSFMVDYCSGYTEYILRGMNATSGRGERYEGIDYYTYQPFCHIEYGVSRLLFNGPNSIVETCIDHRFVHEHAFDYIEGLLYRQLREQDRSPDSLYFDFNAIFEGHEGTHAVIGILDATLTSFMRRLETELHFFDNPRNTLVFMADHGNHMGLYQHYFEAGEYERTTPSMLLFVHEATFQAMDGVKGRTTGESLHNFNERTRHISTPLDLYATFADLLGISVEFPELFRTAKYPPASLFDDRQNDRSAVTTCADYFNNAEPDKCTLDYCVLKAADRKTR